MNRVIIAIQGISGSFHHQVAINCFGTEVEIVGYRIFEEVAKCVANGTCDYGVLAIENSMYNQTLPEMPAHFARWGDPNNVSAHMNGYLQYHQLFSDELACRPDNMRNQIQSNFNLPQQVQVHAPIASLISPLRHCRRRDHWRSCHRWNHGYRRQDFPCCRRGVCNQRYCPTSPSRTSSFVAMNQIPRSGRTILRFWHSLPDICLQDRSPDCRISTDKRYLATQYS